MVETAAGIAPSPPFIQFTRKPLLIAKQKILRLLNR